MLRIYVKPVTDIFALSAAQDVLYPSNEAEMQYADLLGNSEEEQEYRDHGREYLR